MVIYRRRRYITKSGRIVEKVVTLKRKPKKSPAEKEQELIAKYLKTKKRLQKLEAERKKRRKHERFLRALERKREQTIFKCYCLSCRKMRIIKDPEFKIHDTAEKIKSLAVRGKCIVCKKPTNYTIIKRGTEDELKALGGILPQK